MTNLPSMRIERLQVHGVDLEVLRGGERPARSCCCTARRLQPGRAVPRAARPARRPSSRRRTRASADSARPDDFDTVYDLVRVYQDLLDALPDEQVDADRLLVRGLARGRAGRQLRAPAGAADPGRSGRHQGRRARGARHRPPLQHVAGRAGTAGLARSGQTAARAARAGLAAAPGCDVRRGDGDDWRAAGTPSACTPGAPTCTTLS